MIKVLRPDYLIEQDNEALILRNRKYPDVKVVLEQFVAFILSLYDGTREDFEIRNIVEYIFCEKDLDIEKWLKDINENYTQFLIPVEKASKLFCMPFEKYESGQFLKFNQRNFKNPTRLSFPKYLGIYLTNNCIRQCVYCYAHASKCETIENDSMSLTDLKNLIYNAFEIGVQKIILTGGEPLLHPNIYEIIEYITSLHMFVEIATKKRIEIEKIVKSDLSLIKLSLSIDSHISSLANFLTNSSSFYDDMMLNISDLEKINMPYDINLVLSSVNKDTLKDTLQFFFNKGAKHIYVNDYINPNIIRQSDKLLLSSEDKEVTNKMIEKLIDEFSYNGKIIYKFIEPELFYNIKHLKCNTALFRINVKFDGSYIFCEKLANNSELNMGSIYKKSLLELWNSDILYSLLHPDKSLYYNTICGECSDFSSCSGKNSCYWMSYLLYNTLYRAPKEVEDVCLKK